MSNAYQPILDNPSERPRTFDFTRDSQLLRGFGQEFGDRFLQDLEYYAVDFSASSPNNIYGEQDETGIVFDSSTVKLRLRVNIELNPTNRRLEKWGIKEHRDLVFFVAINALEEKNISPKVGDQIKYEDIFYRVTEVQIDSRERASMRPLTVRIIGIRGQTRENAT